MVNSVQDSAPATVRPRRASGPMRLRLARLWSRLSGPPGRMLISQRARRRRRAVDEKRIWRRSRPAVRIVKFAPLADAIALIAAVARAFYVVVSGHRSSFLVDVDAACSRTSFSCDTLAGILGPLFSLALASALFLLVRLWLVR